MRRDCSLLVVYTFDSLALKNIYVASDVGLFTTTVPIVFVLILRLPRSNIFVLTGSKFSPDCLDIRNIIASEKSVLYTPQTHNPIRFNTPGKFPAVGPTKLNEATPRNTECTEILGGINFTLIGADADLFSAISGQGLYQFGLNCTNMPPSSTNLQWYILAIKYSSGYFLLAMATNLTEFWFGYSVTATQWVGWTQFATK